VVRKQEGVIVHATWADILLTQDVIALQVDESFGSYQGKNACSRRLQTLVADHVVYDRAKSLLAFIVLSILLANAMVPIRGQQLRLTTDRGEIRPYSADAEKIGQEVKVENVPQKQL